MAAAKKEKIADPRRAATRVRAGSLRAALADVIGCVESRNIIPVLGNVLIEAGDGRIMLTATDLDIWAIRSLASDDRDGAVHAAWLESIRPFVVTLPAKVLLAVLAEIDADAMVELAVDESTPGRWLLTAGRARFRLPSLPSDDFPLPNGLDFEAGFEMHCSALADMFGLVEHAISTEETRYYLNGIYLHPVQHPGEPMVLSAVATDGHRLACVAVEAPDGGASFPPVIIARKSIALLDKLLALAVKQEGANDAGGGAQATVLVEASASGSRLRFVMPASDGGEVEVIAKTVDGQFPDYTRVIPSANPHLALINKDSLAEAIKRVTALSDEKTRTVKASFSADKLVLAVVSPDWGEASEDLACTYGGPDLTIGFNGKYWRAALGAIATDSVAMALDNPGAPTLIQPGEHGATPGRCAQVLMPMRV